MSITPPPEMTLANLAGGALMECVTAEIRKICENIADPNVQTDAKRKLTITIGIKPDAKGTMAEVTYAVASTLPGQDPGKTMAYIATSPETKGISLFPVETHPSLFEQQQALAPVPPLDVKRA